MLGIDGLRGARRLNIDLVNLRLRRLDQLSLNGPRERDHELGATAGTTTVIIWPVFGARTLSCEPGPAEGGTVTAKWPSMMKRAWLSGQLLMRFVVQQFVLGPHVLDLAGNA